MAQVKRTADGHYAVAGVLDFSSVSAVLAEARQQLTGTPLVVDFSTLEHANSAALALLLQLLSDARADGRELQFSGLPDGLMDLARVSNLDQLLPLVDSSPESEG